MARRYARSLFSNAKADSDAAIQLVITVIALAASAFLGGALNALAGGGSLVTFPALLFAGLNPIDANASSVVALFPATFVSAWAYRRGVFDVAQARGAGRSITLLVGGGA